MIWIVKRIFWIGVFSAVIYFGLNYKIEGRPIRQYVSEFYNSALIQAVIKSGKEIVAEFLEEKTGDSKKEPEQRSSSDPTIGDQLQEEDRRELETILKKEI